MYRQEWIDEIADICDLVRFCWDNGYDGEVENIYGSDSRDECIYDEINNWDSRWTDLRDYLSDLEDSGQYDYWLRDDYDGTWTGIGDYEFNELKEQNLVKARTAVMNGYVKTFVELYPDKEPDEIKLTVKVIE